LAGTIRHLLETINVLEELIGVPGTIALPGSQRLDHLVKLIGAWVRLGANWLKVFCRAEALDKKALIEGAF
jgi:hypothetical protein